tara:strand:- start:1144 stop:2103 length:960 start_codon:yes stop_codon:yes gene_type:complete
MNNTLNNIVFDWSTWSTKTEPIRAREKGLPKNFVSYGARELGIEWNKVKDEHLRLNDSPSKSGIDFVLAQNHIEYKVYKRRTDNWQERIATIENGCLNIFQDGKPLWYETSWIFAYGRGKHPERIKSARKVKYNNYGGKESWGKNLFGLKSLKGIKEACYEDGLKVKYLHLSLDPSMPYMKASDKRNKRVKEKYNAIKFISEKDYKSKMMEERYNKFLKRLNDPMNIYNRFKKAESICLDYINHGTLDQKREFSSSYVRLIENYQSYTKEFEAYNKRNGYKSKTYRAFEHSYLSSCLDRLNQHLKQIHNQDEEEKRRSI